jgi:hypothetical protein
LNIAFIPDVQAKDGSDFRFLGRVGRYIAEKQPEVIVNAGDFADVPSLSSYDVGKRSFEGRRYRKDIDAAKRAMDALMEPIAKARGYKPRLELTLGNHEERINRATENHPELYELISVGDLGYRDYGWNVHPFLKPIKIGGVMFAHYFITGTMGRPFSTAQAMLRGHMSAMAGHQQGLQRATARRMDGAPIITTIAGSCYEHDEGYLGPQGNNHWRGIVFMHDVKDGSYDPMDISLSYLKKRYKE